jgi:hypothetical protein
MKNILLLTLVIFISMASGAQDNKPGSNSSASLVFSSVPVMHISGTDTSFQNAPSISAIIDLRTKNGWGISYAPSFVLSSGNSGIYMHMLSVGYERYGEGKLDLAFSYSHYFFSKNSSIPYSPITNETDLYLNYKAGWISPVIAASFGFGQYESSGVSTAANDFVVAAGLNHHFSWENKGSFSSIELTPSLLANMGSDGYFSFLTNSKYLSHSRQFINYVKKEKGKQGQGQRGSNNVSTSSFVFNNVEGSLEGDFNLGSFTIRPEGSLFIPAQPGQSLYGYAQLTVQYHF